MPRDVVFFDGLSDQFLGHAVRVDVGGVPCVEAAVECAFEERVDLVGVVEDPGLPVFVA